MIRLLTAGMTLSVAAALATVTVRRPAGGGGRRERDIVTQSSQGTVTETRDAAGAAAGAAQRLSGPTAYTRSSAELSP